MKSIIIAAALICATACAQINVQKVSGSNVLTAPSNPLSFGNGQTLSILSGGSFVAASGSTINLTNGTVTLPAALALPSMTGHAGEYLTTNGTTASWAVVAGTGTVTSASVVTANGVSGSVATATTTPAITLTLGDITPSKVNGNTITTGTGTLTLGSATLNAGAGGTLGSAAFTAASAYEVPLTFSTGLTRSTNTVTVNTSQNIATLSNLTTNGFVKTGSGTGALSIDTNTYLTGNQTITLSGDASGSGETSIAVTNTKVNGVTYGTSPGLDTVPVVTNTNLITYKKVPNASLANSTVQIGDSVVALGGSDSSFANLTLTNSTYDGLDLTANAVGWTIEGGTNSKALTLGNDITLTANASGKTLNIGSVGGTLGTLAFTNTSGGSLLYGNGSGGVANVTIGDNLTFDGGTLSASSIPIAANPSATVGLTASNGVATTFMRSDAAPAMSQAITPTWTGRHTFTGGSNFPASTSYSGGGIYAVSTNTIGGYPNTGAVGEAINNFSNSGLFTYPQTGVAGVARSNNNSVAPLYGFVSFTSNNTSGTATVSDQVGFYAMAPEVASGRTTDSYKGLYISGSSTAGTISAWNGVYIEQSSAGATNWGIYDAGNPIYFGGNVTTAGDVEITDTTKGIILKSPDGSRFRITVSDAGALVVTEI